MIVDVAAPFAGIVPGDAIAVDCVGSAGPMIRTAVAPDDEPLKLTLPE